MPVLRTTPQRWPQAVLPARHAWPLFDTAASRRLEARAQAALPPGTLMRRAGLALARWTVARYPHARTLWIAAGPGGNGGDGLHLAAEVAAAGRRVTVSLLADPAHLGADAAEGLARARSAGVILQPSLDAPAWALGVDALLGLGASRPATGAIAEAVRRLNAASAPTLAVDLPTGLAADTGALLGDQAVRANSSLALLTLKPGLFTASGRVCCGDIAFDPLAVEAGADDLPVAWLCASDDGPVHDRAAAHDAHKGRYGDVLIIGGGAGMLGAARLAAHAALGAGAGRTWISLLDPDAEPGDTTRPEWLWAAQAWADPSALAARTVVCGCGGGTAVRAALPSVLAHSARLVLDADALNAVASDAALRAAVCERAAAGRSTILTPHPLEAARLLGTTVAAVQADRLRAARALADGLGAVVVLKGSGTVIAGPGRQPALNTTGNASLATGGTGDVLAGWIGGDWASLGSGGPETAEQVARAGVELHGAAADAAPHQAVRALELVQAMRTLRAARSAARARATRSLLADG